MRKLESGQRLIIGKNSVTEMLRWNKQKIIRILCAKRSAVEQFDLPARLIESIDFDQLTKLSNTDSHQGIAAIIEDNSEQLSFKQHLKNLESKPQAIILMLATVQDPHHLGAAFRAAEVFAADLVVFANNNSSALTPAASKVAVGGSELVPYCRVSNINEAIRKAKDSNFWAIAAEPPDTDLVEKGKSLDSFDFPERSLIVFGSEAEGLPRLTKQLADYSVYIRQKGKIDSLSLSQAISIFLYQAALSRKSREEGK